LLPSNPKSVFVFLGFFESVCMSEIVTLGSGSEADVTVRSAELTNIFQRGTNGKLGIKMPVQSAEVLDALQQINQLAKDYETLKIEVFLRADRAAWAFLSNVYDYVLRINRSVRKRQIKGDLLEMVRLRDRISISSASETEVLVVRYVFSDMARQTRNNYVAVMQKALAMDLKQGELLGVLEQYHGLNAWLSEGLQETEIKKIADREQRKTLRTDSVSLMRRLFALMGSGQGVSFVKTKQVADWTPSARELATVKEANKNATKYQAGEFVFFVATPSEQPDEYKLIQGLSAARDFEDQLLLQIAARLGADNQQLQAVVSEFEAARLN
jgi:hypothetical protein